MKPIEEILQSIDIFNALDEELLKVLAPLVSVNRYEKGNILFYEGDTPTHFYILISGEVKLYKINEKAGEIVLHHFCAPTMIAEMAVIEQINFPATAEFLSDGAIATIEKDEFYALLETEPKLSIAIIKSLNRKIKTLEQTINSNLVYDSTKRVANYILKFPQKFQKSKKVELAKELNMAPETLSRVITKFKKMQIIDGEHSLLDADKLTKMLQK